MEGRIASALRDLADALDELGEQRQKPGSSSALEGRAASPGGRSQAFLVGGDGARGVQERRRGPASSGGRVGTADAEHGEKFNGGVPPGVRAYIIVSNPHNPSYVGFTEGPSPQTWRRIEKHLPNERLCGSRVKLRRVANRAEGPGPTRKCRTFRSDRCRGAGPGAVDSCQPGGSTLGAGPCQ